MALVCRPPRGKSRQVKESFTDRAEPDAFRREAAGRCAFGLGDLGAGGEVGRAAKAGPGAILKIIMSHISSKVCRHGRIQVIACQISADIEVGTAAKFFDAATELPREPGRPIPAPNAKFAALAASGTLNRDPQAVPRSIVPRRRLLRSARSAAVALRDDPATPHRKPVGSSYGRAVQCVTANRLSGTRGV